MSTPDGNDDKTTGNGRDKVTRSSSSEANNREDSNLLKRVKPPKINYSTIIIKPSSKGGVEEGRKESLSNKARGERIH